MIFSYAPDLSYDTSQSMVAKSAMKMLFFSADKGEVEQVSREFAQAGIPNEVRASSAKRNASPELELWIKNDRDCHRAFTLCVRLNIGFAKRASQPVETVQ
jgi:hypothetical protein